MTAPGRVCWIVLAAVVLVTPAAAGTQALGPDQTTTATTQEEIVPNIQTVPETDTTTTRISAYENGSAEWELTVRMELETDADVAEFEAFQDTFEQNRSQYVGDYRDRMTSVVDNAEAATGRQMNASNFTGEIGVQQTPRRWGYVTYRFQWDGFAETNEGRIGVGDVFRGGYFLDADDILIFDVPEGYEAATIDPDPDRQRGGEIQYNGPASFEDERPAVELISGNGAGADDGGGPITDPSSGNTQLLLAVAGLVVILVVAGLAYGQLPGTGDAQQTGSTAGQTTSTATPQSASPTTTGTELATDEDRVRSLLEAEGGRIRQADVADRLDWSDSKTSRVLSDMAEDGDIEKLRIGRENVIDLVDEE